MGLRVVSRVHVEGLSIHPASESRRRTSVSGALASHTHDLVNCRIDRLGALEEPLRHPDRVVRDRQADLDTFDARFPGAIFEAPAIVRPSDWASRAMGAEIRQAQPG